MEKILVYCEYPVGVCLQDNAGVCINVSSVGYGHLYTFTRNDKVLNAENFISIAAGFVCDAIMENLAEKRLSKLKRFAENMSAEGLAVIFSKKLAEYLEMTGNKRKIIKIAESLLIADGLLKETNVVNINGVINFRLKELLPDLNAFLDLVLYEHTVKSQYDDFVSLAGSYVELEAPGETAVHIVFWGSGKGFALYDDKRRDITRTALKNYRNDAAFSEENVNDFLISSLLYLLPQTIVLHFEGYFEGSENKRIIETIGIIFKERVIKCKLCESGICMQPETYFD